MKRGRLEIGIAGANSYDMVMSVLDRASRGLSVTQVVESFPASDQAAAQTLIDELDRRRLLLPVEEPDPTEPWETPLELFHWSAGPTAADSDELMAKAAVTVIGVNEVSKALVASLSDAGFQNLTVVNYPYLCNLRFLDDAGRVTRVSWSDALPPPVDYRAWDPDPEGETACLVATSDFGGLELMRSWNQHCVLREVPFLPAVLQDLTGYLGPFWSPGRGPCFECARARQNANLDDPSAMRAAEPLAFFGQGVTAAYHPALPAALGAFAALEVSRFVGAWSMPRSLGTLLEIDMLTPELVARPVLKLPRCPVCGGSAAKSSTEVFRSTMIPPTHNPH